MAWKVKPVRAIAWASLLLVPAAVASAPSQLLDRVLAVVGTEVITLSDTRAVTTCGLNDVAEAKDPTAAALEYLINRALMLDEVNRYPAPEPDKETVTRALEKLKTRFPSAADFDAALAKAAMTPERLRGFVRDNLRIEAYIDQRFGGAAMPTEQEIARYYQEHQDLFVRNGRVPPLEQVRTEVGERASAARRGALVTDWIERLRRRTEITVLYQPARTAPDVPPGV
jgi:hypothetical protein